MSRRELGIGVIGLGVMGKAHVAAYRAAREAGAPCRLVAVCDRNPRKLAGDLDAESNLKTDDASGLAFDPREVAGYDHAGALLADSRVDAVSICTRTETHVPLAIAALAAGKHVLVEKPLALCARELLPLAAAASRSERLLMPAMCMRFWPGWDWLKARVVDGSLGRLRSATFRRLAAPPAWSRDFYGDPSRSGGALVDLHIHDADFVRHLCGEPASVFSTGDLDHVTTVYRFGPGGPTHVTAEGGWDHTPGFPFRMQYTALFEYAVADFDFTRSPRLLLCRGGVAEPVTLPAWNGYDGEVRAFVAAAARGGPTPVSLADAMGTAALLDAERESLARGAVVVA
jgi:predicted dehydrogenase